MATTGHARAEDRVAGHRLPADRQLTQRLYVYLIAPGYQGDEARGEFIANMSFSDRVQPLQARIWL